MRKVRAKKTRKPARAKTREPLAEGMISLNGHGHRDWKSMSNVRLVVFTKEFMKKNGISGQTELLKADYGLYKALRRRRLLDIVGFEKKKRTHGFFKRMNDEELVDFARRAIENKGYRNKTRMREEDGGLYCTLFSRGLLDRLEFAEKRKNWALLSDEELVDFAKGLIEEEGVKSRKDLMGEDMGLFKALVRRKLLDELRFERDERCWSSYSDDELVEIANRISKNSRIKKKADLSREYKGLYTAMQRRKLLYRLEFKEGFRNWKYMNDDELVVHTKRIIEENGIKRKKEMRENHYGLYMVLYRRGLLERITFEECRKPNGFFENMTDDELVHYAKRFTERNGISGRSELAKADSGLYEILRKRKLLNRVFADMDETKKREVAQALLDGMEEFATT